MLAPRTERRIAKARDSGLSFGDTVSDLLPSMAFSGGLVPLWLKIAWTLLVCLILPIYWVQYGPQNFLWFSDVALILAVPALWLESRLLASMMLLAVGLPELGWNVDFLYQFITGKRLMGLADYMFESDRPVYLRGLSLFHLGLLPLLVFLVHRLGYDPRALPMQIVLGWVIFIATYLLTDPEENINWVFGPGDTPQQRVPASLYLVGVMILFAAAVYVPTHFLLKWLFTKS